MIAATGLVVAALAGSAAAKTCVNLTIPIDISARTAVFDIQVPQTNLDPTVFIQNLTQQGRNFTDVALTGYKTTTGSYDISAQFCTPSNKPASGTTLQILTHGIGFDKTYAIHLRALGHCLIFDLDTGIMPTTTSITPMSMLQQINMDTVPSHMIVLGLGTHRMASLSTRSSHSSKWQLWLSSRIC